MAEQSGIVEAEGVVEVLQDSAGFPLSRMLIFEAGCQVDEGAADAARAGLALRRSISGSIGD